MKNLPIYENLDTSFVNLSALVRFLRGKRFVGKIRIELSGYEAEIAFNEHGEMNTREHDTVAGRIAEGEEAFQRLLIRAREPGGKIHVYQKAEETIEQKIPSVNGSGTPVVQREAVKPPPPIKDVKNEEQKIEPFVSIEKQAASPKAVAPMPLEFSNRVEARARQTQATTAEEWQTLLNLMGELLGTIDKSLAAARLDFQSAFAKARAEIADDYPFLKASTGAFSYSGGKVSLRDESVNAKIFVAGINESLRRILEKLRENPKFTGVYRDTAQAVLALIHRRKPLYDKFFITPQLEKSLGV